MSRPRLSRQQWLALLILMALAILAWMFREPLRSHLSNLDEARTWLQNLGPLGPLMFIAINALQIVVAPIPGYIVQVAGGWVFGVWPGALYGIIGLALGATLATSLARLLGRPFVTRIIGAERLARLEHVTRANRPWLWAVLLLGPVGDIPYFLAGLSRFPIPRLVLMAVLLRSPSVTLAAAVGSSAVVASPALALSWLATRIDMLHPLALAALALAGLAVVFLAVRYGLRLKNVFEQRWQQQILAGASGERAPAEQAIVAE